MNLNKTTFEQPNLNTMNKTNTQTKPDFKTYRLENTPFTIHERHGEQRLLLGNHLVTEKIFKDNDEITEFLATNFYDVLLSIVVIVTDINQRINTTTITRDRSHRVPIGQRYRYTSNKKISRTHQKSYKKIYQTLANN